MLSSSDSCRNCSDLVLGRWTWSTENLSRNHSDLLVRDEDLARLELAVLSLALLAAVLGNAGVLLVTCARRRKPSRMQLFMKHLSLADLAVAFFQVLPQLCWKVTFRFRGPDFLCRLVKHLQVLGMYASTYVTVAMTADRYLAVCHPLRAVRRPARRARAMIGWAWACSLALSCPQYFIFSLSEVRPGSAVFDCWGHFVQPWGPRAYVTWTAAAIFVLPVAALLFCYGFICRTIWTNVRHKTGGRSLGSGRSPGCGRSPGGGRSLTGGRSPGPAGEMLGGNSVSGVGTMSRAKLRTVKMTAVIVAVYTVCWAPFFTVQMWSVWDETFSWDDSESAAVTLSALLASLNSCCNPWIYLVFSGQLLHRAGGLPCCRRLRTAFRYRDSDSSFRRTTLLSNLQGPRPAEPSGDVNHINAETHPQVPSAS
ncbi:arg8-vasotocin receptor-like [Salarias fasciatus]|uniref:Arg8-vasotocin receptor-like n=1 Tax=Salarias fasciatus TaxID=181472 RepID=A0A672HPP4_SALFA|nr:arg8-vasotocin receptor-like [Salarias fasciatus]